MSENWEQINQLFHAALELAPADRAAFLDQACGANEELRREIESLLDADQAAENLTATLPARVAAEMVESQTALKSGQLISHYRVLSQIGAGGMGEVYLAEDVELQRRVAIKLLPVQSTSDPDRIRRFEQEARAASALNHPNIITIHEIGTAPNGRFIVMELVAGETLRKKAAEKTDLSSLWKWGTQIAKALSVAHAAGIVHRDIKPENIMLRDDGYVKLLDFGLARLSAERENLNESAQQVKTNPGALLGTVKYMSPEQVRGETASASSDIFALGVLLYELATGAHPFNGGTLLSILQAIATETPAAPSRLNPEIPLEFDELILKLTEKDPRLRLDAKQVEAALEELQRQGDKETRRQGGVSKKSPARILTVGREQELVELRAVWEGVCAGRGMLLCVAGEPGMGKTTLVEEFLAELAHTDSPVIARGRCSERLAGAEAYLPLLEALESMLRDDRDGVRAQTMRQIAPTWYAQVATLGSDDSSSARIVEDVKTASPERMKRELAALLQTLSQAQPLVIFFDDLHWADVSTIDLLTYLAGKFETMRVLIVATYRPSDLLLAKHPFLQIKPDLQARGLCRELTLGFLSLAEIDRYLALEFPRHRFPAELAKLIYQKTEGNPLFMVDLARYLRDRRVIALDAGYWTLAQGLPEIERELPESVRGMIERKIAQLGEDDLRLLTAASVQGYEFDSSVIAQALKLDSGDVEEQLEKLEKVFAFVQLMSEEEFPNGALTLRYRFVHVLYQNILYRGLKGTRRTNLSAAIAEALLGFHGDRSRAIALELACLFEAARDFDRAAEYFHLAALNAVQLLATKEAIVLARRGLAQLQTLPATRERIELELALQLILGNNLIAAKGFASTEVGQTYARARELCGKLGETPHLLPVIFGLCVSQWVEGNHRRALESGREFLSLAQARQDPALIVALRMVGGPLWHLGELTQARKYFEQIVALHDPEEHRRLTYLYGQEPGVAGRMFLAMVVWLQGDAEQARRLCQESLSLVKQIPHAPSQAYAFGYAAIIHHYLREPEAVLEMTKAVIELSVEHGLAQFVSWGNILQGWARAELGELLEGIEQVKQGIDSAKLTRTEVMLPHYLSLLAELYGKAGDHVAGLATLDEVQALIEKNDDRYWEAELYRLRGELTFDNECFQKALAIARRQGAKSLELRAEMSLNRLRNRQD